MTLSQVIKKLQKIQEAEGDLEVIDSEGYDVRFKVKEGGYALPDGSLTPEKFVEVQ